MSHRIPHKLLLVLWKKKERIIYIFNNIKYYRHIMTTNLIQHDYNLMSLQSVYIIMLKVWVNCRVYNIQRIVYVLCILYVWI